MLERAMAHFYKHSKIMSKRPGEMAWILVDPLVAILSIGIFAYFLITMGAPLESMIFVLAGVVIWGFYALSQKAITYGVNLDIWNDCLKHSFMERNEVRNFILGNSLFGLFSAIMAFFILALLGWVLFTFNIFTAGFFLLSALLSVFLYAISIGLIIDSLLLVKGNKYMSLTWITTGIIMVFSGIYYPVTALPEPVTYISYLIPATHSIETLRAGLGFSPELGLSSSGYAWLTSLIYLAVSVLLFKWALRRSRENGMIARH